MTPEQLLAMGASQTRFGQSTEYSMPKFWDLRLAVMFNHWGKTQVILHSVGTFSTTLDHITTIEQFKTLYTLLTGKEVTQ